MASQVLVATALLLAGTATVAAEESRRSIAGPISAQLIQVLDGDTLKVRARIWPEHYVETAVRLAGIDAPEMKGRCAAEVAQAKRAAARLGELLAGGRVQLSDIRFGKYAGRVVARVLTADGRDVAAVLLAENLVRPYDGGPRLGWCAPP
jgi:endonuclease YncB( thermonuclease family)